MNLMNGCMSPMCLEIHSCLNSVDGMFKFIIVGLLKRYFLYCRWLDD